MARGALTPITSVGSRCCSPKVPPLPTWPKSSLPQQNIFVAVAAQVCPPPAASSATPDNPATFWGVALFVVVPLPSCPYVLSPQHKTSPPATAQVCVAPAAISLTVPGTPALTGWYHLAPARPSRPRPVHAPHHPSPPAPAPVWPLPAEDAALDEYGSIEQRHHQRRPQRRGPERVLHGLVRHVLSRDLGLDPQPEVAELLAQAGAQRGGHPETRQRNGGDSAAREDDQRRRTALLPRPLVAGRGEFRQHPHLGPGQLHLRAGVAVGRAPLDRIPSGGKSERKRFRRSRDLRDQVLRALPDEGGRGLRRKAQRRPAAAPIGPPDVAPRP